MKGDPLFNGPLDATVLIIVAVKVLVVFGALLVGVMLLVWFERRVIADMQSRIGPNRAGPFGLLQTVADGIKLFFKEDLLPDKADRRVYHLAPYLSAVPAFVSFAIIPIGGTVTIAGHRTFLQGADPPVGILFLLAMSSIAVYGIMLAGWSSGSKYPLLGAVRASAQMVSYEAAMSLAVAAAVLASGSLSTHDIVVAQHGFFRWNIWQLGVVPFGVYIISATAEVNRPPFDLVEAEQELVGGFNTEYASIRFALFYLAEFMNTITVSAVAVTLFLGGPNGWHLLILPRVSVVWFFAKLMVFLFVYVWLRATLPRFRYDQLMDLGWKKLIPASLYWLLLVAALRTGRAEGWSLLIVLGGGVAVGLVGWAALRAALRMSPSAHHPQRPQPQRTEPADHRPPDPPERPEPALQVRG